jgi:hypothetical protein
MKKRKPPFALVGVLVVLIGVAVVFSNKQMTSSGMREPSVETPAEEHADNEQPSAPEVPDPTNEDAGKTAARILESSDAGGGNPTPETEKMQAMAIDPVIKPDTKLAAPVQDDSRTSTQWWHDKK